MIYLIEENGRVKQRVDAPDHHSAHYKADGIRVVVTGDTHDNSRVYYDGNAFISIPEKPSECHEWDWATRTWTENPALVATAYIAQRRSAYPSIRDQLDALWKGGSALAEMNQKILAVKAAIPKPQEGTEQ